VLVTGATGFVGLRLCELLTHEGFRVRAAVRSTAQQTGHAAETAVISDIGGRTDWGRALDGVECVAHLAARAHVIGDQRGESDLYMQTNAHGTERLAKACVQAGVRRFIYLSSVKVNGEGSAPGLPFSRDDEPHPADAYAVSKWIGETKLAEIAAGSSMQTAVVRSPLVYGPGVRANFLRLLRWVHGGVPLPFGSVENSRSLVSVWNLCNLIERLLRDSIPIRAVFMVSDGEDLSTPELIRRLGRAMGRPARLVPVPLAVLRWMTALTGRRAEFDRLCGSLTVDASSTRAELGWHPPLSVDEGLSRTARWFLSKVDAP
jgi:nucleoside-diphosphate-sugar epimerase